MSGDLGWFLAGVVVGTFSGIGVSVVTVGWAMWLLVRFAVRQRMNHHGGGPTSRRTV